MYSDLIQELKRYGLSNGSALGRHMGIMDEAADAIERLISDLEEANKRAKTAEKERDAAVEERDALKCCGNCECWSPMYQQCKHPDQIVSEAEEYCKPAYCMACELWQVVQR